MPIVTEQRKRQKNLIIAMISIVTVSLLVLYFGNMKREVPKGEEAKAPDILKEIREVGLNLDLLQDKRFKALTPYDKLPREIKTGRNNPFVPYGMSGSVYISKDEEARLGEGAATTTDL